MTTSNRVHRSAYIGLFTITLTTLIYENLLNWAGLACYVLASVAIFWIGLRRARNRQLVEV